MENVVSGLTAVIDEIYETVIDQI